MYSSDMYMASDIADATMNSAPMMGLFFGIIIFSVILGLILLISYWKIFNKAGKPGWASIIPIYNYVVMIQIAKLSMIYLILLMLPIVSIFATFKINIEIAKKFGKSTGFGIGITLLPIIFIPLLAFADNAYEDNQVEAKENKVENTNIETNVAVQEQIKDETIGANNLSQNIEPTNLNNENVVRIQPSITEINNEQQTNIEPTTLVKEPEQNIEETSIKDIPVINNEIQNVSTLNEVPAVEEPKVDTEPVVNAFNSTPIETQTPITETPSIDLKIENEVSVEPMPELTNSTPEIVVQKITEIPVMNENNNSTETKKVCKNCGEVLPNIVSICPKCGTDNE